MSSIETNILKRVFVLGTEELAGQQSKRFTHWLSIINPGSASPGQPGFAGEHLQVCFGDVVSVADAQRCRTKAPSVEDIKRGVEFFRMAWSSTGSRILISCDYGASRSPGLAYICIADQVGQSRESQAFENLLQIRPNAVPNQLVVQLGDALLGRDGALLQPLKQFYSKLNEEISRFRNT